MDPHTQAEWVCSNVCLFTLQLNKLRDNFKDYP